MTKTIKTANTALTTAINALIGANLKVTSAIEAAKPLLKGTNAKAIREEILPIVAAYYKVPMIDGQRGQAMEQVGQYEAAKSMLRRLVAQLAGKSPSAEFDIPEELLVMARKIVAMEQALLAKCAVYKNPAQVKNSALAQARAE